MELSPVECFFHDYYLNESIIIIIIIIGHL